MTTEILYWRPEDLPDLKRATEGASGFDLQARLPDHPHGHVLIPSRRRVLVPCGLHLALPIGVEAQVRSRSGLAAKHGVFVLNAPGTVDADFRGAGRSGRVEAAAGRSFFMRYDDFVSEHDRMWAKDGPIRAGRAKTDEWGSRPADKEWSAYEETARRCYRISDRAAVNVHPQGVSTRPVALFIWFRTDDGYINDSPMLHNLTPGEWRGAADILQLVNSWVEGEINDLPPSDAKRPGES